MHGRKFQMSYSTKNQAGAASNEPATVNVINFQILLYSVVPGVFAATSRLSKFS